MVTGVLWLILDVKCRILQQKQLSPFLCVDVNDWNRNSIFGQVVLYVVYVWIHAWIQVEIFTACIKACAKC